MTKGQISGATGVYYVAAELSRRNYTALVTTRNTRAIDILAMNNSTMRSVGVQVKTDSSSQSFFLINKSDYVAEESKVRNIVYFFVELKEGKSPLFYIVPGLTVKTIAIYEKSSKSEWWSVKKSIIRDYVDKWDLVETMTA